jgi:PAS domain S-box-containing protein
MTDSSASSGVIRFPSKTLALTASIVVMSVGMLVLIGWTLDLPNLKGIYAEITMKANAALALMLAGASLCLLTTNYKALQKFGQVCAAITILVGLLTLSEHIVGWDLHIDQLLFAESAGAIATTSPGRMGLTSSSCLVMFGIALLLLYRRKAVSFAQILTMLAGLWALLAIIGYAYQAQQLFAIARYTGIALHTALALLLLSLGILAACIDDGLLSIFCERGAAGMMARRLTFVGIVVPFLLGWIRLVGQRAGYFDLGLGTSLFVTANIVIFLLAVWRAAFQLRQAEHQRRVTEAMASEVQALLAGIVESSADAIVSKSLDGVVQSWNFGAERLFGYQASDIIGKSITMIVPPERLDEERSILEKVRRGERLEHFETVRISKAGRSIPVSLTVSPVRNRDGEIIGASKIARDIAEQKQSEDERAQQLAREQSLRNEAQTANRIKDEFLATISHELRTPLNAILGWATMLRSGRLSEDAAAQGIQAIERNAKSQAQLIEDLLDVSRIISGKFRLDIKPVLLTPIVSAALDSVRPAAEAKTIQLEMIIDPAADALRVDEARFQQIIWNLLSNSIKFTPQGGRVEVRISRHEGMAEIAVTDNGDGINADFLPFIFDRFQQADASITRKHSGLGLGLAITRHLVEMHGGIIVAESQGPGFGSTFKIRLPLPAVTDARQTIAGLGSPQKNEGVVEGSEAPSLAGARILAIDDADDTRALLRVLLEGYGADVLTASSAREGLELISEWNPDVLICDIGMPEEDGYSLIRRIRDLSPEEGGQIPAIALTGYVRVEDRTRALEAGYQIFVPKPVEATELVAMIDALRRRAPQLLADRQ